VPLLLFADGEDVVYALTPKAAKDELGADKAKAAADNCFLFKENGQPTEVSIST
jgi:hypothetical protein